jgi:hypothetical protein
MAIPSNLLTTTQTVKPKVPVLGQPEISPDVLPTFPSATPMVPMAPNPTVQGAVNTAAEAVQKTLATPLEGQVKTAEELESDRLAKEAATVRQRQQDVLGKAGLMGTARGVQTMGNLEAGLQQEKADALRKTRLDEQNKARAAQEAAIQGAIGLGGIEAERERTASTERLGQAEIVSGETMQEKQIGSTEKIASMEQEGAMSRLLQGQRFEGSEADLNRTLTREVESGRISVAEKELVLKEQMQLREFSQAEKILGLQQGFQGTQADLDRALTREVEAGRISQQEADRAIREWSVKAQINSNELLKKMDIDSQRDMFQLNAEMTEKGWDRADALEATRLAFEERQRGLDRALEGDRLAQQASQFADEMTFKQSEAARAEIQADWDRQLDVLEQQARERGEIFQRDQFQLQKDQFVEAQLNNAWQKALDVKQQQNTEMDLILRGQQIGIEGQRLDLMREEAATRAAEAKNNFLLAVRQQDAAEAANHMQMIYNYSQMLPEEQGAKLVADAAREAGIEINLSSDSDNQRFLDAANGDYDRAVQLAAAEGKVLSVSPVPGQSKSSPYDGSLANRLGGRDVSFFDEGKQDWVRPQAGSYVKFTNPVNAPELPYKSLPAGTYRVMTGKQIAEKLGAIKSINGKPENDLDSEYINQTLQTSNVDTPYFVDSAGNAYVAVRQGV